MRTTLYTQVVPVHTHFLRCIASQASKPMEQQGSLFCAPHTSCNNCLLADPGYGEDQHIRRSGNSMQEVGPRHAIEPQLRILNYYFAPALRNPAQAVLSGSGYLGRQLNIETMVRPLTNCVIRPDRRRCVPGRRRRCARIEHGQAPDRPLPHTLRGNEPHCIHDGRRDRLDSLVSNGCPRPQRLPIPLRSRFQPVGANSLAGRALFLQNHLVDARGGRK